MSADLERTVFSTPRAAEFFDPEALQTLTSQPRGRFGDVVVKELIDNALDACESAGVTPQIEIEDDGDRIWVSDNGPGLTPELVERVLDFNVLVSDKAAYRSPTRGQQGNALTLLVSVKNSSSLCRSTGRGARARCVRSSATPATRHGPVSRRARGRTETRRPGRSSKR